jgi:hypothetical protein
VHSHYGGPGQLHLTVMRVRATRQHGDWRGQPTESGLGLQKVRTRFITERAFSAIGIEEGAGSLPAEGGIAGEDAGRWFAVCDTDLRAALINKWERSLTGHREAPVGCP